MENQFNKTVLCILDGLGHSDNETGNAVKAANMVNMENARANFPSCLIKASGPEVGLVDAKDPGNSEVGHNAIGSGQYIKQGLALLNDAFETSAIFDNDTWRALVENAKKENRKLNVITLLSDGRLHSDIQHLFKLLHKCAESGVTVSIHALLDGRDVGTQSAMKYIAETREEITKCGVNARIATVAGRGVLFMDRYRTNLKMLTDGIDVAVHGKAPHVTDIEAALNAEYAKRPDMTDESMPPFVLEPQWLIKNGDSVLLLNYRGDRAVEMCQMFDDPKIVGYTEFTQVVDGKTETQRIYPMQDTIGECLFAGVMQYDAELEIPKQYLCPPPKIENGLTQWLCNHGVRQYTVTETVKYGHLTYFFNGNRATPFDSNLESWQEIKSDNVDLVTTPEMKAREITDAAVAAIVSDKYDFIKLNIPNPDMVGHTANFDAAVAACKVSDECVGKLIETCRANNVNLIITADHGNAEEMLDSVGKPKSAHTNNLVPFILVSPTVQLLSCTDGELGLTNIAATVCNLLGVPPSEKFNRSIS